jgi:hypothetical protein
VYLIDTNIISELRKGARCDRHVTEWFRGVRDDELFTSVLVVGEIRQGIERLQKRDSRRAATLERWLDELLESYRDRIIPVDEKIAQIWGRMNALHTLPAVDSMLAASAQARGLILVTRNVRDIQRSGVRCLNPFEFESA